MPFVEAFVKAIARLTYAGIPEEAKRDIASSNGKNAPKRQDFMINNEILKCAVLEVSQMPSYRGLSLRSWDHILNLHPSKRLGGNATSNGFRWKKLPYSSSHLAISGDQREATLNDLHAIRKHPSRPKGHVVINSIIHGISSPS